MLKYEVESYLKSIVNTSAAIINTVQYLIYHSTNAIVTVYLPF